MIPQIYIKKSSGALEIFDRAKLIASLKNAGASMFIAEDVAKAIESKLKEGMPTSQIYSNAFKMLRRQEHRPSIRYSLRRSIASLGPTGFPFEDFIGEIFKAKGFSILNDVMVRGKCIEHEIDVVAYNEDELIFTEIKFHNQLDMKSDVKVALYIKARFDDLRSASYNIGGKQRTMTEGLLVTNTKFTENAIRFGMCSGVGMIGWNYPAKGNLHDLIEETQMHPLTCLSTLTVSEKRELLAKEIVTCKALKEKSHILKEMGISDLRADKIFEEIHYMTDVR